MQNDAVGVKEAFVDRHVGPRAHDVETMLKVVGAESLDALVNETLPKAIRMRGALELPTATSEHELLAILGDMAAQNETWATYIGMGYHGTHIPAVLQRNVLENPGWYTQYTPYQPEISQGRLEALINFQTMVTELTGLPVANASLLDEGTAAAEAMSMASAVHRGRRKVFVVADSVHPQTLAVVQTRAKGVGVEVRVAPVDDLPVSDEVFGVLVQYPTTDGAILDYTALADRVHGHKALLIVAADILSLAVLRPPGEFGADIAVGSTQRFGVPMGFGGPHAGYMATTEKRKRLIPGRLIGVSVDSDGRPAYRLALQTREQHIRRDKATSNICTSQVLLAIMAGFYAVWHGPEGLRRIAHEVHTRAADLYASLAFGDYAVVHDAFFDTLKITLDGDKLAALRARAEAARINLRYDDDGVGVSLDETTNDAAFAKLLEVFDVPRVRCKGPKLPAFATRTSDFMTHEVFHRYRSEHEMLRYLHRLQAKDLSLTTSMIPLGSCTMKLNGTSAMQAITWPAFANVHPFAPKTQWRGYAQLISELETYLAEITGFAATTLQPNAGSQGEFTGLSVIRAYHEDRGESQRDVCLIPVSAHGTNPASAVVAGMKVVGVGCDEAGNVDLADLRLQAEKHADRLAALMVTYPSTHGVFETGIAEACEIVHAHGGLVYLDGANMNAQVGLARPGDYGADVCHLNLHKTFAIPHGGGGPGVGPVCATAELAPYLPGHPLVALGGDKAIGPVASAPYGSALVLPISWFYIRSLGAGGLRRASEVAILNANYMATRLEHAFGILYRGEHGRAAHEFILDCRPFRTDAGVSVDDIAKRLMDYGFHAPTMSWPVPGTLMVEPTESESKEELDRFCDAMLQIRDEIREIADGRLPQDDNPLHNAPHTAERLLAQQWSGAYARERGAYPVEGLRRFKYWPPVGRVDNAYGDRHFFCTCPSVTDLE